MWRVCLVSCIVIPCGCAGGGRIGGCPSGNDLLHHVYTPSQYSPAFHLHIPTAVCLPDAHGEWPGVRTNASHDYVLLYSGKYSWGPNFILFILSLSEQKCNTQNIMLWYDGRVFLCKMDRTKIKHTNQLERAQNEIWDPRKFPAIW